MTADQHQAAGRRLGRPPPLTSRLNPTVAVTLSGAMIVTLVLIAVGVAVWRFDASERSSARVADAARTVVVLGEMRQNLLLRLESAVSYRATPSPQSLTQLAALGDRFDRLNAQLSAAAGTGAGPARLERLSHDATSTGQRSLANGSAADDAAAGAALTALQDGLARYAGAQAARVDPLVARARHDAHAARLIAIIAGIVAAAITLGLVLYVRNLLRTLLEGVRRGASTLSESTQQMHAASQESAAALSQQAVAVADVSATAETLNRGATAIAGGAESMSAAAEQTAATVGEMRGQIMDIAERSRELGRYGEEIGAILTLLTDIADRTDLLALNASIEAAHAGEAGSGFAVVAAEIRDLAERSARSTSAIRDLVASVQDSTAATIAATDRGAQQADQIVDLMQASNHDLQDGLLAAEQQRVATKRVAQTLVGLDAAVSQLSAEQSGRVTTTRRVEELTADLAALLERHGIAVGSSDRRQLVV